MTDRVPVRRALLSVSEKTGLVELARALVSMRIELVSTGGTARAIREAGLPVTDVEAVTGFPEMMDGRVKTLHPKVHGGILALRDDAEHGRSMRDHGISPIDLVCINLYPFESTIAREGVSREEAIENIDVGGPAMIRAAAKNHAWVVVVTDPSQYSRVLEELRNHEGSTGRMLRESLAAEAFLRTARYDGAIAKYLRPAGCGDSKFADVISLELGKVQDLRYGENPHQAAAVYQDASWVGPSVVGGHQLHGKELSYNNLNDAAAALSLAHDLIAGGGVSASVIKHANPCGAALASKAGDAVELAMRGDPLAAYGGILATSGTFDIEAARRICVPGVFLEVIVAAAFDAGAVQLLKEKSSQIRLLQVGPIEGPMPPSRMFRSIPGGALMQDADTLQDQVRAWEHKAGPAPDDATLRDARAVVTIAKHLSSNAIAIGGRNAEDGIDGVRLFGAGAGQMDRVTSCRLAIEKAGVRAKGSIAAGDAFFPFPDGPELLIRAGISVIIHPGGSKRDQETFDLCEKHGVCCITTGIRHFRH